MPFSKDRKKRGEKSLVPNVISGNSDSALPRSGRQREQSARTMLLRRAMAGAGRSALARAADPWRKGLPARAGILHPLSQVWASHARAASMLPPTQRTEASPRGAAALAGSCGTAWSGAPPGMEQQPQQPLTAARPSANACLHPEDASSKLNEQGEHAEATWNAPFLQFLNVLEDQQDAHAEATYTWNASGDRESLARLHYGDRDDPDKSP